MTTVLVVLGLAAVAGGFWAFLEWLAPTEREEEQDPWEE